VMVMAMAIIITAVMSCVTVAAPRRGKGTSMMFLCSR
jgi:hypothetical protein